MMLALLAGLIAAATPFRTIVESHFDEWDSNRDGVLSATELDCLSIDHSIQGEPAAAIASLKLARRSTKVTYPPFSREYLLSTENDGDTGDVANDQDEHDRAERAKGRKGLVDRYVRAAKRISSVRRDLFLDQTPDLDACHQGALGDCFLVAAIGATVHRDAQALRGMISQDPDGTYTVNFKHGGEVKIAALTDAQICMTSTTGDEGLWLPVLEEAYGLMRARTAKAKPGEVPMEEGSDAIAHGGSMRSTIRALTGHETSSLGLKGKLKPDQSNLAALTGGLRKELQKAFAVKRLVGVSTAKEGTPPGVSGNHAYAVLGFDAEKDEVRIWNPHGNTFNPKGEPGIEHGYLTRRGIFTVPLKEVVQVFRSATFETESVPKRAI